MSNETCAYCDNHVWDDESWYHICLREDVPGEIPCDTKKCQGFRVSQRGMLGSKDLEDMNVINMDELEAKATKDKYTRGK